MRDDESSEALSRAITDTSTTTSATPSKSSSQPSSRHLNTSKSLRNLVRPSPAPSSDAGALHPSAMKSSPTIQPRKSTTSLFNLFSKPKVEKARGYGGEGPTPQSASKLTPPPLKSALKTSQPHARPVTTQKDLALRTISSLSLRPHFDLPTREDHPKDSKPAVWTAPPLFQAFAKSAKHGLAEVGTNAIAEKYASLRPQMTKDKEESASVASEETEGTTKSKMTVKGAGTSVSTHVELPQKIIVLLDTGQILQYSQHGPTNRLPEKILQLCPDSAAMVSHVVSDKQHAMRVVHSVAQKPFSLAHTFSRLTKRSASSKRDVASLVIIFSQAQELEDWLQAIRGKIAELCQPETSIDSPIQSKVDSVIGDTSRLVEPAGSSSPPPAENEVVLPVKTKPLLDQRASLAPQSPPPPRTSFDDLDDVTPNSKGSLELLEEEAEKLISVQTPPVQELNEDKRSSDVPSYASSNTSMGDHHTLNNLRNSLRMSYLSSVSGLTSRTSSLISEPSSNQENAADTHKSPYRSLSSYQSKRRSVLPVNSSSQPISELPANAVALPGQVTSPADIPVKSSPPAPSAIVSRSPSITSTQKLTALPEVAPPGRMDATPPIAEEDERPQSILADLPPPSTWSSKLSPKKRHSFVAPPMTERQLKRMSSAPVMQTVPTQQQSRRASQTFRLPLKINPDTPATRPPSRSRSNRNTFSPDAATGEPQVFTLEAKIDPRMQRTSMGSTYSGAEARARSTQRLSLFPSPLLSQDTFTEDHRRTLLNQTTSDTIPPRRASLQRPISLQVRTDRAPFVSSIRNSMQGSPPNDKTAPSPISTAAPPIRSLKPSRSSSAISSMQPVTEQARPASPTDPFQSGRHLMLDTSHAIDYRRQSYMSKRPPSPASAPPMAPLPFTPVVPMGNSFAQRKTSQRHSFMPRTSMMASLPGLDFGIPVVGLGPPAPPPNAPLPAPPGGAPPGILSLGTTPVSPPGSRRPSTASIVIRSRAGSVQGNGLGIQVGS